MIYVCIITWNRLEITRRCVNSLMPAIRKYGKARLLILDQGSTDGSEEFFGGYAAANPLVTAWHSTQNLGVGAGRQRMHDWVRGMGLERDDAVIHIDSDSVATDESWLEKLTAPLSDDIWGVGVRGCDITPGWVGFENSYLEPGEPDVISGGLTAYRGAAVLRCEFDQQFGRFWHEDSDFAFQIRACGKSVWAQPDVPLTHEAEHRMPDAAFHLNFEAMAAKWRGKGLVKFEQKQAEQPVQRALTWIGAFDAPTAYPIINRQLTVALERQGVRIERNEHLDKGELTPAQIVCQYPPKPPVMRHTHNICLSLWEFDAVPGAFVQAFADYDQIVTPGEWVAQQFRAVTNTPVQSVPFIGVDPGEFNRLVQPADWRAFFPGEDWVNSAGAVLLWVGGTDYRHGFDLLGPIADSLHPEWHIVAKQSAGYPGDNGAHPRVHVLTTPLASLAPLYRAAVMLIAPVRAVGFHMPILEALACGTPVVATDLPPIREYAPPQGIWLVPPSGTEQQPHHIYGDKVTMAIPDVSALCGAISNAHVQRTMMSMEPPPSQWLTNWTWDAAATRLREVLNGQF